MVLKFPKSKNVGTDRDIATYFLSDGRALCYIYIPTSVNEGSLENSTKSIGMYRRTYHPSPETNQIFSVIISSIQLYLVVSLLIMILV